MTAAVKYNVWNFRPAPNAQCKLGDERKGMEGGGVAAYE